MTFAMMQNCFKSSLFRFLPRVNKRNISVAPYGLYLQNTNKNMILLVPVLNRSQLLPNSVITASSIRTYSKYVKKDHDGYNSGSDSDSDSEKYTKKSKNERGSSHFWRSKMRTIHGLFDVNKDGVLSFDDFNLLAERFKSLGHLSVEENKEFQEIIKKTWEEQWGEPNQYNLVTVEQYLTEMHHMLNDKDLKKKVHLFLPYLFKAVDKDNSGFISLNEFTLFFKCLGLTEVDAASSFAVIDKNGDGKLSIKEFVKLGRDYFFTDDEKRISKMFWGPISK